MSDERWKQIAEAAGCIFIIFAFVCFGLALAEWLAL